MGTEAVLIEAECPEQGSRWSWSLLSHQPRKVSHCSGYQDLRRMNSVRFSQQKTRRGNNKKELKS